MAEMEWARPLERTRPVAAALLRRLRARFLDWEVLLTLGLTLAAALSITVALESGGWTRNMPALTSVALVAAVGAMLLARSPLPAWLAAPLALLLGALVTFWQALLMVGPGSLPDRTEAVYVRFDSWFTVAFSGGVTNDSLPFNVLIVGLTWIGVFIFGWSVFRWHNAWIGLIPGGAALFLDIAFVGDSLSGAAALYMFFGFLLVMRTSLMKRMARWQAEGTGYPALVSFSVLHMSSWALILLLALAWVAPAGPFATPAPVATAVESVKRAGVDIVRLAGPLYVKKVTTLHDYTGVLPFQGSIELRDRELMSVTLTDPKLQGPLPLRGAVYDEYTSGGWETGRRDQVQLPDTISQRVQDELTSEALKGKLVPVTVQMEAKSVVGTVVFTPGQLVSVDRPLEVQVPSGSLQPERVYVPRWQNPSDAGVLNGSLAGNLIGVDVIRDGRGRVAAVRAFDSADQAVPDTVALDPGGRVLRGESYNVTGFLPAAAPDELRLAGEQYPDWVLSQYLQVPASLPGRVAELADSIAGRARAQNAYDRAMAIEEYLRTYPVDYDVGDAPPGSDSVDYFLFESRRGYFDYHASAMVVMLRTLGVPARLAVGFVADESDLDRNSGAYVLRDRNSYAWAEVYFPKYGWLPFNPTPDRPADLTPQDRTAPKPGREPRLSDFPDLPIAAADRFNIPGPDTGTSSSSPASVQDSSRAYTPWVLLGIAAFLAALSGAVLLGWRRSVAGLPYSQELWEKTVRLASWAGHPPRAGETPSDYGQRLQTVFRAVNGIPAVVAAYNRSRFGRHEANDAERQPLRKIWRRLRITLLGAALGRMLRRRR